MEGDIEGVAERGMRKLRNGLIKMLARECDFGQEFMRKRQLRIQLQGLRGKLLSYREVFPAEQHSRSQKICRRRVWRKAILGGESPACVVVVARVEVAESQHVTRINSGLRCPVMRRFEQWNCIGRPAQPKQRQPAQLRRLFIMGVLFQCTRKCSVCFNELVLRVQGETAQSIDTSWCRLPAG